MIERFLRADDLSAEQTWELLDWCRRHGAADFTIDRLGLHGHATPVVDRFETDLATYRRESERRPRLVASAPDELVRVTELWHLCAETIEVLRRYLREGLFTYPTSEWEEGCLEGPTFFRDGHIMLGVVSHEREAILVVSATEHDEVSGLGIQTRERPEWM